MESCVEGALLLQGVLEKRRCSKVSAMVGKSWDQRWFVLTSSSLTYYRSQEDRAWGAAGTVLSLTSLRRFECLSSLVFQLYFFQRILQLRAAQEQEAKKWITCLQSIQSLQQEVTTSPTAAKLHNPRPAAANGARSPGGKSASALVDGVLIINARSSTGMEVSQVQGADAQGVLPAHLLVEESRVSYSPLSEHAAASPFLSDAHMQLRMDKARGAVSGLTPRHPASAAEAATSTEDETQMSVKPAKQLNFAGPTTVDKPSVSHQRSQSAIPSSQSPGHEALAVTSRSTSYHASSNSPFDRATGGFFAPEDIDQLYALPEGAHPGRLRFTDDLETTQHTPAVVACTSSSSSPLYRSCSSGSDDGAQAGEALADPAGTIHDVGSALQQLVGSSGLLTASTAASMPTSRDDRVFWVAEQGSEEQPFTEYTKQQMGSTLHQAPAPEQPHALPSMSPIAPSKQSQDGMQAPAVHAWTTHKGDANMSPARHTSGHRPHQSARAWTAPLLEAEDAAVVPKSSSRQGSFHTEGCPHPPDVPGPHSGLLHATSGFRGGRREDPRLRRFKDAGDSIQTPGVAAQASTAVLLRQAGTTHSVQDHGSRSDSPVSRSGMLQAAEGAPSPGSDVGMRSVEFHELSEVEMIEPEEKQYWRAPPSLAWATLPTAGESSDAGNVTWAQYCSDSEESVIA